MALYPSLQDIGGKPAWQVYQDTIRRGNGSSGSTTASGGPTYSYGKGGATSGEQAPSVQSSMDEYLKNMKGSPEDIYESQMGPIRRDIDTKVTETGQQLQSVASRTGQSYGDLMARYLPEAIKPMGQASAAAAGQAQQFSLQRQQLAAELAKADQMLAWDKQKFYENMRFQAEQLDKQLASQYRIAMAQAGSAREQATIQQNFQLERERLAQNFQWQTTQFQQAQQNWRQSQTMQLYDKYYGSQNAASYRNDILQGSQLWQNAQRYPSYQESAPNETFYQSPNGTWTNISTGPSYTDLTPYNYGGYGSH